MNNTHKYLLATAGAGLLIYGIIKLKKKKKNTSNSSHSNASSSGSNNSNSNSNPDTSQNPEDTKAASYAILLFNAMDRVGTDEQAIENVFNGMTPNLFKKVYEKFGRKSYANGIAGSSNKDWTKKDLVQWLDAELSTWFDSDLRAKIKPIINAAGYQFD